MLAFVISPKAVAALIIGLAVSVWIGFETSWWWLVVLIPITFWSAVFLQLKSIKDQLFTAKEAVDNPRKFVENKAYDQLPIHQKWIAKYTHKKYKERKNRDNS